MADTTLPALLDTGTHAARPAASAVGTGALYSCTDHSLVYQTDGSSWTTWATLGTSTSLVNDRVLDTATAIWTTTSATFVDVTGLTVTLTTGARRVLVIFTGSVDSTNAAGQISLDVAIDGTRQGGSAGLLTIAQHATTSEPLNASFSYLSPVLTAASHTIKLQALSMTGATVRVYLGGTGVYAHFAVMEQPA